MRREWARTRTRAPLTHLDGEDLPDNHGDRQFWRVDLGEMLDALSLTPEEREALLAYSEGRTQAEAAEIGWPGLGAAGQKRLSRLRERVRRLLTAPGWSVDVSSASHVRV